jgi:hypothetical protein
VPPQRPIWLSPRQQRLLRLARAHVRARVHFFALFVTGCVISLLLLIAVWMSRAEMPLEARNPDEWTALLGSPDISTRADAVHDLSRLAITPVLPCDLMVEKLNDAPAVRIQMVALLTKVLSRGRCMHQVADVLRSGASARSRAAAAQVLDQVAHRDSR